MGVLEEILAELRAIHTELRLIREAMGTPSGALETDGDFEAGSSEEFDQLVEPPPGDGPYEEPQDETDDETNGTDGIDDEAFPAYQWLTARGVVVKNYHVSLSADPVLDRLAMFLGDRFGNLSRLHDAIRRSLSLGNSFTLSLASRTQAEIADSTQFCTMLSNYAFLSSYRYDKRGRIIRAAPQHVGHVVNFFTGGWFERYVHLKLEQLFEQSNLQASCLRNPQITLPNGNDFELDLFFLIGGEPLWVECKTGNYQAYVGKYGSVRKILSVPKERTILTILGLPENLAAELTALHDITMANERTFMRAVCTALDLPDCLESLETELPQVETDLRALNLSPTMTSVATATLATWFKKNHLRPSPEHRRVVLEALPAVAAALGFPATANDLKRALAARTGVSKKRLQDILNAVMRGGCLLDEEGAPVSASNVPFHRLASDDPDVLEAKCVEAYARVLLEAFPSYFDSPYNVVEFEQVVGCKLTESIDA